MASQNIQDLKQCFDRDGFVVIRHFLSAEEIQEFRDRGDAYIRDIVPTLAHHQCMPYRGTTKSLEENDAFFRQQLHREDHLHLLSSILGDELEPGTTAWNDKPANSAATPVHQDSVGNPSRRGITLWVALDDADLENGCLHYGLGSHRHGLLPNLESFYTGAPCDVAAEVRPGDAVIHHSFTVHWTDTNNSGRPRRAYTCFHWGMPTAHNKGKSTPLNQFVLKLADHLRIDQDSASAIVMRSTNGDAEAIEIVSQLKAAM